MNRVSLWLVFSVFTYYSNAQNKKDSSVQELQEVVISFNKWETLLTQVPQKLVTVNQQQIFLQQPQTSADLLAQTNAVFVQKSQLGGGSPMIRGFATNRVLLVVDGVRMNNAIYRSGNLQNVISIDPLSVETAEVIFGPGSLTYGSDAIGGVMHFRTLPARFSTTGKTRIDGSALTRYSTATNEKTIHADINFGTLKFSSLSSASFSNFDDVKMGKYGGDETYLRKEYVDRINNADQIVLNENPRLQRLSGYDQFNFLQKFRYLPHQNWDIQYSYTYAETGDAPRYDRLIQYRNGNLRFAEWYYGPMIWKMHNMQVSHTGRNRLYDELRLITSVQHYKESRIDRTRNNSRRNRQEEEVDIVTINADARKELGTNHLFYGAEYVVNKVGSAGETTDISNGMTSPAVSRYPDGSRWTSSALYLSYKHTPVEGISIISGVRYSYNTLNAAFSKEYIHFPYDEAVIRKGAVTGSIGAVFQATETWQLNATASTGYRMPNIDDIGKLFESTPGNITVPNPQLEPEYAWNFELGINKKIPGKFQLDVNGFHTLLSNAIVKRMATFNNADSILFDGTLSAVEMLQNVARATVWGLQADMMVQFSSKLSLQTSANWINGRETDDEKDEQVPLRHAPPFYGGTKLTYKHNRLILEAQADYNGMVSAEDMPPSEQSKSDIYAVDRDGRPYSPSWYVLHLKTLYKLSQNLTVTAAWENISNRRYRPYSSGIVAPGSNLVFSARVNF